MNMNDPNEVVRAAEVFLETHDDPLAAVRNLAGAAKQAGLYTEFRYWTNVTAEVLRRMGYSDDIVPARAYIN